MSYTYDDALLDYYETSPERSWEALTKELEGRKVEELINSIKNGYENSKDLIEKINRELIELTPEINPQSQSVLVLTLLEIIERDIIFFPLLFSDKGITADNDSKISALIRESIDRNINTAEFVCKIYQHRNSTTNLNVKIESAISTNVPGHDFFGSRTSLLNYREMIKKFRNNIIHGKRFASKNEAIFMSEFIAVWREEVLNSIIGIYGLKIDPDWSLH